MRLVAASLLAVLAIASPAGAVNGFVIGLEAQRGGWSANPVDLAEKGGLTLVEAQAFTSPLDGVSTNGVNLHLGWNVLGWAAIEATLQTTFWTPFEEATRGGVGLVGGRVTYFPLQHWLPTTRPVDVGVELGYGYVIGGGPTFGMDGRYLGAGLNVEYYPTRWFSLALGYRHFFAFLDRFYLNYEDNITRDVEDFTATWGTVFVAMNFHLAPAN